MQKGLLVVNTGNGKGKTTAALGMAMRAAGHGLKVCFIQFIKGSWKYGELESVKKFKNTIDFHVMGNGFTWKSDDLEKDKQLARQAWDFARQAIVSDTYHTVVLDEFTYLLHYGMIDAGWCFAFLKDRPEKVHIVITGRYAPRGLTQIADLVSDIRAVKHPLQAGVKAQKGIEF